jgi:SAM-dependent methyltransferase
MKHKCLACNGGLGKSFFRILDLPLVDSFSKTAALAKKVNKFTVNLCQCNTCSTIQIASPPDTSVIYKEYIYESKSSPDLKKHFLEYALYIKSLSNSKKDKILEIGCNDGLLLKKLHHIGFYNLNGVDPSPQTSTISIPNAFIVNDFFTDKNSTRFQDSSFDFIIANNCFSHIPDLVSVLANCKKLLKSKGTLVIEVQSTLDLLQNVIFDYIYHEHYFYHSVTSFEKVVSLAGLEIYDLMHVDTKGGSYRFLVGHRDLHKRNKRIDYWKYREKLLDLHSSRPWVILETYLRNLKKNLHQFLRKNKYDNIYAYGASATTTVLHSYMGLEKNIKAIIDDNVKRQGLFAPGSGIPVVAPKNLTKADICIISAWRHANLIISKLSNFKKPYIIPLPKLIF